MHHGHMPEIELTSDTTATGIWAMEDHLWWPEGSALQHLHGYGHYHETYVKLAGGLAHPDPEAHPAPTATSCWPTTPAEVGLASPDAPDGRLSVGGFTRGFTGRRRDDHGGRLPPGQYDTGASWPVLSAEITPRLSTDDWTFTVDGLVERETTWSWDELQALPHSTYAGDIHCVTTWSKFDMTFTGVSVDVLLAAAGPAPSATHVLVRSHTGYTTNLPLADVVDGKAWVVWEADGEPLARRARRPGPPAGAPPVLLEERQVGLGHRAARPRRAGLLGAERLPRPGRPLDRAALPR